MKFLILLAAVAAANAWDPKKTFLPKNEIEALSCKNGKANLADGQEVTIESPNFPENYPNKAKCNWKIKVPANEEMHIWCETFDLLKGDFLRVKGLTPKLYGSFDAGFGEYIPASSEARTLKVQFRSNKKKNAGGFRCQIAAYAQITGSGSGPTTGSGSGASCLTNDGPAAGSACAFPFNFMGVSHTGCTTIDGDPTPWCSTLTDENNDHVSGVGAWGYCDASCPLQETGTGSGSGSTTGSGSGSTTGSGSGSTCLTNDGPAAGSACAFPFNFMGTTHFGCTTIDGDTRPWCSTQTDENDDHVTGVGAWGYCDASCPVQETVATTPAAPVTTAAPGPVVTAAPGTCQCGVKGGAANGRIVGGQETEQHEYPWQVGLVSRNGRTPWCGGTLISSTHVLTAAHCTDGAAASNIRVLLGEHNIADSVFNRVDVAEIINHPDYDSRTTDNDYAILRLSQAVTFTNEVAPACLPADTGATYAGVLATVTGWGTLSSGGNQPTALQEVDVTVTTNTECNNAYGSITANMICAADSGKDSCQGDSGGPLIAAENGRQALIGVVSWGRGCAFEGFPGVYARVTEKMSWILANTAGTFSSSCAALN